MQIRNNCHSISNNYHRVVAALALMMGFAAAAAQGPPMVIDANGNRVVLKSGDPSLKEWLFSAEIITPPDNKTTPDRAELGKKLFFDPRLSATGRVTCASCHFPERGWADGMPTALRFLGTSMERASPSLVNMAYNNIFMWDGRQPSLEHQSVAGQGMAADVNAGATELGMADPTAHLERIKKVPGYVDLFSKAYPGEDISIKTIGKALASFQRTILSTNSPFDHWVQGDDKALTSQQINGLRLFIDPNKGNCAICHSGANFTDNGFHNIGLRVPVSGKFDIGRYKVKAVNMAKGAFKTPTLRDIDLTAPYFHDGSARALSDVIQHYVRGGEEKQNLSPNIKPLALSPKEQNDLIAFLKSLTTEHEIFQYPSLPR